MRQFASIIPAQIDSLENSFDDFKVCSFTATRYINHVSLATLV